MGSADQQVLCPSARAIPCDDVRIGQHLLNLPDGDAVVCEMSLVGLIPDKLAYLDRHLLSLAIRV